MELTSKGSFSFGAPVADFQVARSGDPEAKGAFIMRGHAAVFNRMSHDLGGFKTRIKPGFFTQILDQHPDVHLNREHDMRMLLARTRTGALELREDPYGLHVWAKMSRTALADETAILMQDGTLDQMSFACDIGSDEWTQDEEGNVTRDLLACAGLYDVALCAQGAFPQTSADLVASLNNADEAFAAAQAEGRIRQVGEVKGNATASIPRILEQMADNQTKLVELAASQPSALTDALTNTLTPVAASEQGQEVIAPLEGDSVVADVQGARDSIAAFKAAAALRFRAAT